MTRLHRNAKQILHMMELDKSFEKHSKSEIFLKQ